jgi:hypothetical protein
MKCITVQIGINTFTYSIEIKGTVAKNSHRNTDMDRKTDRNTDRDRDTDRGGQEQEQG